MRLKLYISFLHQPHQKYLIQWDPLKTVKDLKGHLKSYLQIQQFHIEVNGFRLFDSDQVGHIITEDAIIEYCLILIVRVIEENQDRAQVQLPEKILPIQKTIQKQQKSPLQEQKIQKSSLPFKKSKIIQEEDSSSSDEVIVKKPNPQNKLSLKIQSPAEELAVKQQEWKKTFTQQKPVVQQKPQTILSDYRKIESTILADHPYLIIPDDYIQFKHTYLDIEKCEPAVSKQLRGKILENKTKEKMLIIQSDNKLELTYNEIIDLELDFSKLKQERKEQILKLASDKNIDPHNIGNQINFYYSDKNYTKDEFIQQHSARDPNKFMLFELLMNFPKVKRVVSSDGQLLSIVQNFMKNSVKSDINFELKEEEGKFWIRKKI
ncbi:hypothetical protein pb186bvf_007609 [Paramecium bursaria]